MVFMGCPLRRYSEKKLVGSGYIFRLFEFRNPVIRQLECSGELDALIHGLISLSNGCVQHGLGLVLVGVGHLLRLVVN